MTSPATVRLASGAGRRRRRRPLLILVIVIVILVGLLVAADFGARAYAEDRIATQIQQQGFPQKPSVTIDGFPFLTQAVRRDFGEIQIDAGPFTKGELQIQSIDLTLDSVHVDSSLSSGVISHLTAALSVTFPALASAISSQSGDLGSLLGSLTLSAAGPGEVEATLDLPLVGKQTAVWKVTTQPGSDEITLQMVSGNGVLPTDVLSALGTINLPVQSLPFGLSIQSISVTPSGLTGTFTGQNVHFSG